jgi:hypothetical protein
MSPSVRAGLRNGPPSTISDRVFENELNIAVFRSKEAYDKLLFREALKCAGYDLTNARDVYRWGLSNDTRSSLFIQSSTGCCCFEVRRLQAHQRTRRVHVRLIMFCYVTCHKKNWTESLNMGQNIAERASCADSVLR